MWRHLTLVVAPTSGRNLFTVHSKKRMVDDPPEVRAEKSRTNRRTLTAMLRALKEARGPPPHNLWA